MMTNRVPPDLLAFVPDLVDSVIHDNSQKLAAELGFHNGDFHRKGTTLPNGAVQQDGDTQQVEEQSPLPDEDATEHFDSPATDEDVLAYDADPDELPNVSKAAT